MSEKGLFGSFEHLGHGLLEIALGIGAVALGIRFFKDSVKSSKEKTGHG
jgi:hypothetical protein